MNTVRLNNDLAEKNFWGSWASRKVGSELHFLLRAACKRVKELAAEGDLESAGFILFRSWEGYEEFYWAYFSLLKDDSKDARSIIRSWAFIEGFDRRQPHCPIEQIYTRFELYIVEMVFYLHRAGADVHAGWIAPRADTYPNISESQFHAAWAALMHGKNPVAALWPHTGCGRKLKSRTLPLLAALGEIKNANTTKDPN
jgi:hypothetical protein